MPARPGRRSVLVLGPGGLRGIRRYLREKTGVARTAPEDRRADRGGLAEQLPDRRHGALQRILLPPALGQLDQAHDARFRPREEGHHARVDHPELGLDDLEAVPAQQLAGEVEALAAAARRIASLSM